MKLRALILLAFTPIYLCQNINDLFENINLQVLHFNARAAELVWDSSVNPGNPELPEKAAEFQNECIKWEKLVCDKLATLHKDHLLNNSQIRQKCLMCSGPKYNFNEARLRSRLYYDLQKMYTEAEICISSSENIEIDNIQQVEIAILKYLTKIKNFKNEHDVDSRNDDFESLDAKIANKDEEKGLCLKGEDDFEKVMELSKDEAVLRWIWLVWREKVGPSMKEPYRRLIDIENVAARRNGYGNIGASWRHELEIPDLRQLCRQLYNDIKPLYTVLHGVIRFYLRRFYGEIVPERGPIPAHLLGNLWSQNWEPLIDLITPKTIDLNQSIKKLNWTALDMAKKAEDFYQSFGLPAMTDTFWRESVFARGNKDTRCHGTAADMYKNGDFRLIYCSGTTIEDLYVFHHEMGHIQYFMAYENQPALFRGANAALHESIGDAVMYGVMTPQHLHRLGLVNDSLLYVFDVGQGSRLATVFDDKDDTNDGIDAANDDEKYEEKKKDEITEEVHKGYYAVKNKNKYKRDSGRGSNKFNSNENQTKGQTRNLLNYNNMINESSNNYNKVKDNFKDTFEELFKTDDILLLKQALNKLPQIPFSLLIDEYRWKYFEGDMLMGEQNREFWKMATELQGIAPSNDRGEDYLDVGAKFHVPDHTPYIRYFLSSFLQHQLFETLCKAAVYGKRTNDDLPDSITLNRCDIYGSKTAGKILKDLMSRGNSQHWRDILEQVTGDSDISAASLLRYYRPLYEKLLELVQSYNIPLGWEEGNKSGWYFA